MQAFQEEHGVVVARDAETGNGIHHAGTEIVAVSHLKILGLARQRVIIIIGGNVGIVFVIALCMCIFIHQPFVISEKRHFNTAVRTGQHIQFGKRGRQFRRPARIENHHVGLVECKRFGKRLVAAVQVCDVILDAFFIKLLAQPECKHAFVACPVITVDDHNMIILETTEERIDGIFIQRLGSLVHLIDVFILFHMVSID